MPPRWRALLMAAALPALAAGGVSRQSAPAPPLPLFPEIPEDLARRVRPLLAQGVMLHDQRRFDEAVAKYREALAIDPDNSTAWYEIAFSLSEKGDLKGALAAAQSGLARRRRHDASLYMMAGNLLDQLGRGGEAVEVYEQGVAEDPDHALLRYNLGVTYAGRGEWAKARASEERAILLNPAHPGSHLQLAKVYAAEGGYDVPAFLAVCRFLELEPDTPRSAEALLILERLFRSKARMNANGVVDVVYTGPGKSDEGEFSAQELAMSLLTVSRMDDLRDGRNPDPNSSVRFFYGLLKAAVSNAPPVPASRGFARRFYVPYFAELMARGHFPALATLLLQRTGQEGVAEMKRGNAAAIEALRRWSERYRWAR